MNMTTIRGPLAPRRSFWGKHTVALVGVALYAAASSAFGAGGVPVDAPIANTDARVLWRWIGLLPDGATRCPGPNRGAWEVSTLFGESDDNTDLPPGLASFCLYVMAADTSVVVDDVRALQDLVTSGSLSLVEPDFMAVSSLGSPLQDLYWQEAEAHFLEHAGRPLAGTWDFTGTAPRLVIVDTAPTNDVDPEAVLGTSSHGFGLINMSKQLLCETPAALNCVADVSSRLSLAWSWPQPGCSGFSRDVRDLDCRNGTTGGIIGMISEIARALNSEVDEWWQTPSRPNLILNLSLGWLPQFGGAQAPSAMPLSVLAVYRALQDASCRGALVFAAAGNAKNGPSEPGGPLFPAAWEDRPAPRFGQCRMLLGMPPPVNVFPPAASDRRSLVYAVAGVDEDGERLFTSRVDSEPRFVAFADHAVVEAPPVSGTPSAMLTGTSVASAVAASAAAAAWYYQPTNPGWQIINTLVGSGMPLGRGPDFCRNGPPCPPALEVRQLNVCAAAMAAGAGVTCPVLTPLDLSAIDFTDFILNASDNTDLLALDTELTDSACVNEVVLHPSGDVPDNPCPHRQYHGTWAESWTGPQPGSHPCPPCNVEYPDRREAVVGGSGDLYIALDDEFDGVLTEPVLKCGPTVYALDLVGPFVPGYTAVVSGVPCEGLGPVELSFTLNGDQSVTSPVLNLD